jgi:O-antigen biosynthesis protein
MWSPVPVLELELTRPPADPVEDLSQSRAGKALMRWRGTPVGWLSIPIVDAQLSAEGLVEGVLDNHLDIIARWALSDALDAGLPPSEEAIDWRAPPRPLSAPKVSVVVCTRERPDDLRRCLSALRAVAPAPLEVIIVDNAPTTGRTKQVAQQFPAFRYVCEPRPGLDWARNRGILDARGEIVAFIDDDVVVDASWAGALQQTFERHPSVQAVTGLIAPLELSTAAQAEFELLGGFGRGFVPRWFHYPSGTELPWGALGTGVLGTGANMAFRRALFERIGLFLPQLDTGTVTEGGGDLEILYRTLKYGYPIAYEPRALAWHRHRAEHEQLVRQLGSWGIATFAMLESVRTRFPDEAANVRRYGLFWKGRLLVRATSQYLRPRRMSTEMRDLEFRGAFIGKQRYYQALERVRQIEAEFGAQPGAPSHLEPPPLPPRVAVDRERIGVRTVDLSRGARSIDDVSSYFTTRVFIEVAGRPIGQLDIHNRGLNISATRLIECMLEDKDAIEWMRLGSNTSRASTLAAVRTRAKGALLPGIDAAPSARRPAQGRVSIVLATCDRPHELRRCLASLTALRGANELEIVVVDNRPSSPATSDVAQEFPSVILVSEPRQGLSYARNAGFLRATGEIIVCTDDDVIFAPDWLDCLLLPFRRSDIDIVCGNVLPMTLDAPSQISFEQYGGLGKGYDAFEADQDWFYRNWSYAAETWKLGATANTAFRAKLLRDPDVGMFEEVLGPGVPSGVGEDTYFFYRALRHGYRLRYEPSAVVWHEHRKTARELEHQLSAYSRGHVAYHLHTLIRDGDFRALPQLARVASWQLKRVGNALTGRSTEGLPLRLVLTEIRGNLQGPLALWRSHRLAKVRGRSAAMPALSSEPETGSPSGIEDAPVMPPTRSVRASGAGRR